jgi:transposase
MSKISKQAGRKKTTTDKPEMTMGIDVGDRYSHLCLLDEDGEVLERDRVRSTEAALRRHFADAPRLRIALECGTHSPWMSRLLKQLGHQVVIANARKIPTITESESKNDCRDAEQLARMAAFNPKLLSPLEHRSLARQQDLNLVQARTMIVNALRGLVKSAGGRLPACSSESFPTRAAGAVPPALANVAVPLVEQIARLNMQIGAMDQQIEKLAIKYPEIGTLRSATGVGPLVAAAYVLTLDRPNAVPSSRSAGAFLGLRPGQSQSGDSDPERRITRTGNTYLRCLLVQSAQYVLGRFGPDSALRRWGLKLAASGATRAKKRAIIAVARKLAVVLHSMWRSGQRFEPFPQPVQA